MKVEDLLALLRLCLMLVLADEVDVNGPACLGTLFRVNAKDCPATKSLHSFLFLFRADEI